MCASVYACLWVMCVCASRGIFTGGEGGGGGGKD